MTSISACSIVFVTLMFVSTIDATCLNIKKNNPHAPSGVYKITSCETGKEMEVYCEMGLNGGGYTFLSSRYLPVLSNNEIQKMFTDRTSLLMRFRTCDSGCTQPYIVLKQLSQYADIPIKIGLNEFSGYTVPKNVPRISPPCLYYGFIPAAIAKSSSVLGVSANGEDFPYNTCDPHPSYCQADPNNYFALFANYLETQPINNTFSGSLEWFRRVFECAKVNPSRRMMPEDYFYFMEANFGNAGYMQTDESHSTEDSTQTDEVQPRAGSWVGKVASIFSVATAFR
jgi:hypothetical protein